MKNLFVFATLVSLTFFFSCSLDHLGNDFVPAIEEPSLPGSASFVINTEDDIFENHTLALTNSSSNVVSYHWDFGNGHTSTEAYPAYKYPMHGNYAVKLTITDGNGNTDQASQEITVLCIFNGGIH